MKHLILKTTVLLVVFMFIGTAFLVVIDHCDNPITAGIKPDSIAIPSSKNYYASSSEASYPTVSTSGYNFTYNLTLLPGAQEYFFSGSTPARNITSTSWEPEFQASVNPNNMGFQGTVISMGNQSGNYGNYTSSAANYQISGFGIVNFSKYVMYSNYLRSFNSTQSLNLSFNVTSNALAVIMVAGGGVGSINLSDPLFSALYDFTYSEAGNDVNASGAAFSAKLSGGSYKVNINSTMNSGTNSGTGGILAAIAYIFYPTSQPSSKNYKVTFNESGLPAGTTWSVTLNGSTMSSTTNTASFTEANGTYSYSIGSVSGYMVSPSSGTVTINGGTAKIEVQYTITSNTVKLFSDSFTSDSYLNTSKWSGDSSVIENITKKESTLFSENITTVSPPNFIFSFDHGLKLNPIGYDNMAGFTSSHAFTSPFSINVNFSEASESGGNGMIILSNETGSNVIGIFLGNQIYVQNGNANPSATGYDLQNNEIYSLSLSVSISSFILKVTGDSGQYSQEFTYTPSGNQSMYLTLGSLVGTFPGETYDPTASPQMIFYNTSVSSNASWNLSIVSYTSSGYPDSGVNLSIVNSFNNMTYYQLTPANGTLLFRGLRSGQYEVIATQSQGGYTVSVTKYIFIGEPQNPSLKTIYLSLNITPPPPPPLQVSIDALNSTLGEAPWLNTFIAAPAGYVGNYSYQWRVNGVDVGNGPELNREFESNNSGSAFYIISLTVISQGKWFGTSESPESSVAITEQTVYKEPIYLTLGVSSPNSYVSESYGGKSNWAVGFVNGGTLDLNANFTDTYLSNTIPKWLMSIVGISYPYWGINMSDSFGNHNGIIDVFQPGSSVPFKNVSLPGTINSLSDLNGLTFDVTLNPYSIHALLGDIIQIILSAIGVIGGLSTISSASSSIIPDLVEAIIGALDHQSVIDSFKLFTGSPINIVKSLVNGFIGLIEDMIPELPSLIKGIIQELAPNALQSASNLISSLSGSISQIFPAWKLFDLGFDFGAVIGAAFKGDLSTQYRVLSYNSPTVYTVNDPNASIPYVTVAAPSGMSGWSGSWVGSGYSHSSFTQSEYTFAVPSNQKSDIQISNPSSTMPMQYNVSISLSNHTELMKGALAPRSSVRYVVNSNSTSFSVSKFYTVLFSETGLPSGTSWSVTFNGSTLSSTTNTITFTAASGTYSYSIGSLSGYTVSPSSGSTTVNGKNVSQGITFSASPKISSTELYAIIGAAVAIAVIGSAIAVMGKRK